MPAAAANAAARKPLHVAMNLLLPGRWREANPNRNIALEDFQSRRLTIVQRDRFTCRGCGFTSAPMEDAPHGEMEVHFFDGNPLNLKESNLVCVCPLCNEVFYAGLSDKYADGRDITGQIILSSVPQRQISLITLMTGIAKALDPMSEVARSGATLYQIIRDDGIGAINEQADGRWDGDPSYLMSYLEEKPPAERQQIAAHLPDVRYMPLLDGNAAHYSLFRSLARQYANQPPEEWVLTARKRYSDRVEPFMADAKAAADRAHA